MKKKSVRKWSVLVSLIWVALSISCPLSAKEWPERPITLIVGWAAGGSSDLVSRTLADSMSRTLGVPVVVDNKTGSSGLLSLGLVSKAKPDGYTIGFMSTTAVTEKPFFVKKVPFDPVNGFTYLASVYTYVSGWAVRADSQWKSLQDMINAAMKQPGKLNLGIIGINSTQRVYLAKLEEEIPGLKGAFSLIPFKGGTPTATALVGGHVDATFQTSEFKPFVDSGTLRLLALSEKMKEYANVKTFAELGYRDYGKTPGVYVVPTGLPEPILNKLAQAIKKAVDEPGFEDRCIKPFGMNMYYKNGKEIYTELMNEYNVNKKIIPKLGIPMEE